LSWKTRPGDLRIHRAAEKAQKMKSFTFVNHNANHRRVTYRDLRVISGHVANREHKQQTTENKIPLKSSRLSLLSSQIRGLSTDPFNVLPIENKELVSARCFSCSPNASIPSSDKEIESFPREGFQCNCRQTNLELANYSRNYATEFAILTSTTFPSCHNKNIDKTRQHFPINTNPMTLSFSVYRDDLEACLTSLPLFNGGPSNPCYSMATHINKEMLMFIDFCVCSFLS